VCSFRCHEKDGGAASVAHCSGSNLLVTASSKNGVILVFSLASMQLVKRIDTGKSARIHRMTYDPLADVILAGAADGAMRVRGTQTHASCR
jgi:WD40 repeat protein